MRIEDAVAVPDGVRHERSALIFPGYHVSRCVMSQNFRPLPSGASVNTGKALRGYHGLRIIGSDGFSQPTGGIRWGNGTIFFIGYTGICCFGCIYLS